VKTNGVLTALVPTTAVARFRVGVGPRVETSTVIDDTPQDGALPTEGALRLVFGSAAFTGRIDAVGIWQRALSDVEVARVLASDPAFAADGDGDAVPDGVDNCATVANAAQVDSDGDGIGDACARAGDATHLQYTSRRSVGGIADVSGRNGPLLQLEGQAAVSATGLVLPGGNSMARTDSGVGVNAVALDADGFSVEVWATPLFGSQPIPNESGPSRLFSISDNTSARNFTLAHEGLNVDIRHRTTQSGVNGTTGGTLRAGLMQANTPTHLVATVIGSRVLLFQNGLFVGERDYGGLPTNWNDAFPLVLGNERSGDRAWRGTLHLAAFHDRALDVAEVIRNFRLGPFGDRGVIGAVDADDDAVPDSIDRCVGVPNADQSLGCPSGSRTPP
jgi:hypothetical protein